MAQRSTGQKTDIITGLSHLEDAWADMPQSFERALRAQNKAKGTVRSYTDCVRALYAYLAGKGMPLGIGAIKREHLETYLVDLQNTPNARTGQPILAATLGKHYKALSIYFTWALEEGEIREHPMAKMKRPIMPEDEPSVIADDDIDRLIKSCNGHDFYARRDTAIIRLLLDTGIRVSELVGLKIKDIDGQRDVITVLGKGRKHRNVPFGRKTAQALDRYMRVRAKYPTASLPDLWLGHSGKPLTSSGVLQIIHKRGEAVGILNLHPHQFRHNFAQTWLGEGGTEISLMRIAGWTSRSMIARYSKGAQTKLAHEEHSRLQPGDKY